MTQFWDLTYVGSQYHLPVNDDLWAFTVLQNWYQILPVQNTVPPQSHLTLSLLRIRYEQARELSIIFI